jgi:hypothetical protein
MPKRYAQLVSLCSVYCVYVGECVCVCGGGSLDAQFERLSSPLLCAPNWASKLRLSTAAGMSPPHSVTPVTP